MTENINSLNMDIDMNASPNNDNIKQILLPQNEHSIRHICNFNYINNNNNSNEKETINKNTIFNILSQNIQRISINEINSRKISTATTTIQDTEISNYIEWLISVKYPSLSSLPNTHSNLTQLLKLHFTSQNDIPYIEKHYSLLYTELNLTKPDLYLIFTNHIKEYTSITSLKAKLTPIFSKLSKHLDFSSQKDETDFVSEHISAHSSLSSLSFVSNYLWYISSKYNISISHNMSSTIKPSLLDIAFKYNIYEFIRNFTLSPHSLSKNLKSLLNTQGNLIRPKTPSMSIDILANQYLKDDIDNEIKLLTLASKVYAIEIGSHPFISKTLYDIYKRNTYISTKPTEKGKNELNMNEKMFYCKRIVRKPFLSFNDESYVDIEECVKKGMIVLNMEVDYNGKNDGEFDKFVEMLSMAVNCSHSNNNGDDDNGNNDLMMLMNYDSNTKIEKDYQLFRDLAVRVYVTEIAKKYFINKMKEDLHNNAYDKKTYITYSNDENDSNENENTAFDSPLKQYEHLKQLYPHKYEYFIFKENEDFQSSQTISNNNTEIYLTYHLNTTFFEKKYFKNITYTNAMLYLKMEPPCDFLFRPSYLGPDYLTLTYKINSHIYRHVQIKQNASNSFLIGNTSFSSLKELIEKYYDSIRNLIKAVINHRKYYVISDGCNMNEFKQKIIESKQTCEYVVYYFTFVNKYRDYVVIGYASKKNKVCFEYVKIEMNGFCFHDEVFGDFDKMVEYFKKNYGKEEYMYYKEIADEPESCEEEIEKDKRCLKFSGIDPNIEKEIEEGMLCRYCKKNGHLIEGCPILASKNNNNNIGNINTNNHLGSKREREENMDNGGWGSNNDNSGWGVNNDNGGWGSQANNVQNGNAEINNNEHNPENNDNNNNNEENPQWGVPQQEQTDNNNPPSNGWGNEIQQDNANELHSSW